MPRVPPTTMWRPQIWLAAALLAYLLALILTAWLCDDAYITYRVIDNAVHGHGLRWNVGERVQVFTHPLWLLVNLPVYAVTREAYYTFLLTSVAVSLATLATLVIRLRVTPLRAAAAVVLLVLSKAHVDFATAGLENPLLNLILVLAAFTMLGPGPASAAQAGLLALLTALLALCRPDAALLTLPALAVVVWRARPRATWRPVALGLAPLAAWTMFALVYYGAALPNTAYAKLNTGIATGDLVAQGWRYLGLSLHLDRVALPIIVAGLVVGLARRRSAPAALAAGIAAHLAFVVLAGGDFMSGRFLTPSFLVAVVLLVHPAQGLRPRALAAVVAVAAVAGLTSPYAPLRSGAGCELRDRVQRYESNHGVGDERAFYYPTTGLLRASRYPVMPAYDFADKGRAYGARLTRPTVFAEQASGMFAFCAGPRLWMIDRLALGDAFLARLPAADTRRWRIGHFLRDVPEGYPESIMSGEDRLADKRLSVRLRDARLATQAPLLAPGRLAAIWRFNFGD